MEEGKGVRGFALGNVPEEDAVSIGFFDARQLSDGLAKLLLLRVLLDILVKQFVLLLIPQNLQVVHFPAIVRGAFSHFGLNALH